MVVGRRGPFRYMWTTYLNEFAVSYIIFVKFTTFGSHFYTYVDCLNPYPSDDPGSRGGYFGSAILISRSLLSTWRLF